jgi:hypothetical protein
MKHPQCRLKISLIFSIFAFITLTASGAAGQTVINNPYTPRNPNSGRTRTLTPVVTITDEGGAYYFKRPSLVQLGPDGSIYVADQEQLLRFDSQGRFVRNYFRKGQGPGELSWISGFSVVDGTLVIHNVTPSKIVRFDLEGRLLSDSPATATGGSLWIREAAGRISYLIMRGWPDRGQIKGSEGIIDQPNSIISMGLEKGASKIIGDFPTRVFIRSGAEIPIGKIFTALHGKYLAVSHTDEYAIKIMDLKSGALVRTIMREYKRVKTPPEDQKGIDGGVMLDGKVVLAPAPPFAPDLVNLFAHGDEIWAVTSTKSAEKGVLVDVFNWEGAYLDCFYLLLPAPADRNVWQPDPQTIQEDFLAAIEKNADDAYLVRKYRIGK